MVWLGHAVCLQNSCLKPEEITLKARRKQKDVKIGHRETGSINVCAVMF